MLVLFLRGQNGGQFCHACVAKLLQLDFPDVLAAAKRLRSLPGFTIDAGKCVSCARPRLIFGFLHSAPSTSPAPPAVN